MPPAHPFAHLAQRPDVRECCKDTENLTLKQERPDLLVGTCVCGLRHFKLSLDPVAVFQRVGEVGGWKTPPAAGEAEG